MNQTKQDIKKSYAYFNKLVTFCLITGILIVSGFIIYLVIQPEPPYQTFTILNEDQKMENYPTNATRGEPIYFYVGVGNYLERDLSFRVKILKGNSSTILNETGSYNANWTFTTPNTTIYNNAEWISPQLNISFYAIGERILIAELYEIKPIGYKFLDILWLRINVTN